MRKIALHRKLRRNLESALFNQLEHNTYTHDTIGWNLNWNLRVKLEKLFEFLKNI